MKGKYVESFCSIGGRVKNTPWTAVRGVFDIPWVWLRTNRNVSVKVIEDKKIIKEFISVFLFRLASPPPVPCRREVF